MTAISRIKLGVVDKDARGTFTGSRLKRKAGCGEKKTHTKSFKNIDSHYCRKDTNRK